MAKAARLGALVSALGLLVAAPAASAATFSIGSPQLVSKLNVTVPVTYSCAALPPGPFNFADLSVSLEQATHKAIATGAVLAGAVCNGQSQTEVLVVAPTVSSYTATGVPFKTGEATARGDVTDCGTDPITFIPTCDNATVGPMPVKISSAH